MENVIMSDQTPETLGGNVAVEPAEPSMEDILASIRRIIADDETDVVKAEQEQVRHPSMEIQDLDAISTETLDQNTIITDIDSANDGDILVLDEILDMSDDDFAIEDLEIPTVVLPVEKVTDERLTNVRDALNLDSDLTAIENLEVSFENPEISSDNAASVSDSIPENVLSSAEDLTDDIDIILDDRIETISNFDDDTDIMGIVEAGIADIEDSQKTVSEHLNFTSDYQASSIDTEDDDVIDLVGDLLSGTDIACTDTPEISHDFHELEQVVNQEPNAATIVNDAAGFEDISGDEDMDLVKSLLADLTDSNFIGDDLMAENVETAMTFDQNQESGVVTTNIFDNEETELVDQILDMAIEDEIALSETSTEDEGVVAGLMDDVETEFDNEIYSSEGTDVDAAVPDETVDIAEEEIDPIDASINSLLQIAASAERDAETPLDVEDIDSLDSETEDEVNILDDDDKPVTETDVFIETEDVDMALTPEADGRDAGFADLVAADLMDDLNDETDADRDVVADALMPEVSAEAVSLPSEDDAVFDALTQGYYTPLEDDIFDTPDVNAAADEFEETLTPDEAILPVGENLETEEVVLTNEISSDDLILPPLDAEQESTEMPKLVAKDGIIDDVTEAATVEAFASLNQVVDEKTEYQQSGPRIGDLVQDALKPMLKEWLDENLKSIVERAVTKEVKRISAGK